MAVSLFFDYKDKLHLIFSNNPESIFWFTVMLFFISVLVISEKAATNALKSKLKLPTTDGVIKIFKLFPLIGLLLGFMLLEYAFEYKLESFFIWSQAVAFWAIGCFLWVMKAPILAQSFFMVTAVFMIIAIVVFAKMEPIKFKKIEKTIPVKTNVILLVFISLILMVLSASIEVGIVMMCTITIIHLIGDMIGPRKKRNHAKAKEQS